MMRNLLAALLIAGVGCSGESGPGAATDGEPPNVDGADPGKDSGPKKDSGTPGTLIPGKWITVKAGTFSMGSPANETCRDADESLHKVTLTRSFEMAETEVTRQQFTSLMKYDPSFHTTCSQTCPVEWVTWHEAAAYCNAVSRAKKLAACYACSGARDKTRCKPAAGSIYGCKGYRLPTEAEWERAARAGTQTAFHNGGISSCMGTDSSAGSISWYKVNSLGVLHPVKTRSASPWKLFDMSGNVYEWVNDWYSAKLGTQAVTDPAGPAAGTEKVFRGGAWYFNAEHARAGNRERFRPTKPFTFVGFRCVRSR